MPRTIVDTFDDLLKLSATWYGKDFAFDCETSSLSYVKGRILGLALTFAPDESYYIVFEHSVPEERVVSKTRIEKELIGYQEEISHTKGGRERRVQVPQFREYEVSYEEIQTHHPSHNFIDRTLGFNVIRGLLAQNTVTMVGHHIKFDTHHMSRAGVRVQGKLADTMLAAKLIDENRSVGLKELAYLVGMEMVEYSSLAQYPEYDKHEILSVPLDLAAKYAMMDTEATWKLWELFRVQLAEKKLTYAFRDLSMPLLPVLQEMEARGIAMDLDLVRTTREQFIDQMEIARKEIWDEGITMLADRFLAGTMPESPSYIRMLEEGEEILDDGEQQWVIDQGHKLPVFKPTERSQPRTVQFKPTSDDHISTLLYDHHKLVPDPSIRVKTNKKGEIGVDKGTIHILRYTLGEDSPPVLGSVLSLRQAGKQVSTYLNRFLADADPEDNNCLRGSFNQHVANTGRLSSSSPNLQNITSRGEMGYTCRSMFVARPGMKLIVADYSMMELRIAAHYSHDPSMMQAFSEGMDLHTLTASRQSGISYEELTALIAASDESAKLKRSIGKTSNFGLLYGMHAAAFQRYLLVNNDVYVTRQEAQGLIDGFNETLAGFMEYKGALLAEARADGYVKTMAGRRRNLPNLNSRDRYERYEAERQCVNAKIQGTCADVMSFVMPPIHQAFKSLGGSLLLQIHDEIVGEVPEHRAEAAKKIMQTLMMDLVNGPLFCPLIADAHIGTTWANAKGG